MTVNKVTKFQQQRSRQSQFVNSAFSAVNVNNFERNNNHSSDEESQKSQITLKSQLSIMVKNLQCSKIILGQLKVRKIPTSNKDLFYHSLKTDEKMVEGQNQKFEAQSDIRSTMRRTNLRASQQPMSAASSANFNNKSYKQTSYQLRN